MRAEFEKHHPYIHKSCITDITFNGVLDSGKWFTEVSKKRICNDYRMQRVAIQDQKRAGQANLYLQLLGKRMSKTILITGANGRVGSALVKYFDGIGNRYILRLADLE